VLVYADCPSVHPSYALAKTVQYGLALQGIETKVQEWGGHHWNNDPLQGHPMGCKCPILPAKHDKLCPALFSNGRMNRARLRVCLQDVFWTCPAEPVYLQGLLVSKRGVICTESLQIGLNI
jgi:hypothetical protein